MNKNTLFSKFKRRYKSLDPIAAAFFSMSVLVIFYVGPFIFYRTANHEWTHALINFFIFIVAVFCAIHTYLNRPINGLKLLIALLLLVSTASIVYITGVNSVFWGYPAITASFFLMSLRRALLSAIAYTAVLFVIMSPSTEVIVITSITTTLLLISFANYFIFKSYKNVEIQLQDKAGRDYLTGVGNRASFEEKLHELTSMQDIKSASLCILIFDLDDFKSINDTYGHLIGDRVLVRTIKEVKKVLRTVDNIYRYGGEEFAVLLQRTSLESATLVAEKIRKVIFKTNFNLDRTVTVSLGIAMLKDEESHYDWITRADAALYKSKRNGKNRTTACLG